MKYMEYNLINNIPIMYPTKKAKIKFNYCPRYRISTPERLLECFSINKCSVKIGKIDYFYIKLYHNKSFKTLNNEVEALFSFVITDNIKDYNEITNLKNYKDIYNFIINNNHYIFVTTPILKYKTKYYTIANNEMMSIVYFNNINNNNLLINKLIYYNCYTICDNTNIITSLYQSNYINKNIFCNLLRVIFVYNKLYYTPEHWIYYMNVHRILNCCDFPLLFLSQTPHLLDEEIFLLLNKYVIDYQLTSDIYMETIYKNINLFTATISCSYPKTTCVFNEIINDPLKKSVKSFMMNKYSVLIGENSIFVNDYYGLFASICSANSINSKNSLWKYWNDNNLYKIFILNYNDDINFMIDILVALFRLYKYGYDDRNIRKKRVRSIWNGLLNYCSNCDITLLYNKLIICNMIEIPYIFLLDIYNNYNINYGVNKLLLVKRDNFYIYKNTNLYKILINMQLPTELYYFNKNIIQYKIYYSILSIYKKFNMFKNDNYNRDSYNIGDILIEYIKNNINLII